MRRRDMEERLELYGLSPQLEKWTILSAITLQIDTLENTSYRKEDMDLLLFALSNIVGEMIPDDARFPPVTIDQTLVVLTGQSEDNAAEFNRWIYSLTESIQQAAQQILKLTVSIGVSLPFGDIKHTSIAFREGLEALKHRIHLGLGVIIHYASMNAGRHQVNLDYPWLTESELFDAIRLADEEKAREALERMMATIFKHEMTPQEYQVPINRLLNNILVMMQESGIRLSQLNPGGESFYEELNRLHVAREIGEWFRDRLILPLIRIFRERQHSQYHSISETILDRIHKAFFRKETGQTFSEYLSAYRFAKARQWLIETEMTVKEIAERLRYQNSQNFIRSFRKQEGMTPGQYRESHRKMNS